MKTIQLNEEVYDKMVKLKYTLRFKSYNELVECIFYIIKKFKLEKEIIIKKTIKGGLKKND